ncbi:MAG TPA: GerMN domain-containing protein [Candidatus Angelobacter sp.]|nr:GerMN domain-containing protein [Candidatus Angelobacter sp.]
MPSGEIVRLYFPCGDAADLHPVERSTTTTGAGAIADVVRLFLEGPTEQERLAGFSSLLSPGDMEVAEIRDGRLVLDFPAEVDNVSTSAGSRSVLEGLRMTLLGLEGVDEIELRLRNECAAFFEWIQVGPTCHRITDDGLLPTPTTSVPAVQVPTCEHSSGAYLVTLPEGWWTNPAFDDDELGAVAACRFFGPAEFEAAGGDRDDPIPAGTAVWVDYLENSCVGYTSTILTSRDVIVAGYPASVSELAFGKEETGPPFTYEYVVTLTPDTDCEAGGRYILAFTSGTFTGELEDNRAVLDQIMETIEIRQP